MATIPRLKLDDPTLFGNDAGEDEDESVLVSYFVNQRSFENFLNPEVRLQVAKGRKGIGKSALLVKFAHDLRKMHPMPIVLHLVPSSLAALKEPPQTENPVLIENYWKQVICGAINMELANDIGFAWGDNEIALVESAEIAGFKGRNIISALSTRMLGKVNVAGAIEIKPTPSGTPNHEQLLKRVRRRVTADTRTVWFLLDDIDTKYRNTPQEQAYVASFFSAVRNLVREIGGLGVRATVRTDVWSSLRTVEDLDKFDQYVTDISWVAKQQHDILANRILAYYTRNHPQSHVARSWKVETGGDALIGLAFLDRMRWGDSWVPATQVLRSLSGGRPRWMAQLCRLSGVNAVQNRYEKIGIQEINQSMREFGKRRLSDLYKEHGHQFDDLKRLIESFSNGPKEYTTDDLMKRIASHYLRLVSAQSIPEIDGAPYRDSWQIAHFLYKCGFISGNNLKRGNVAIPDYVNYDLRPDLLEVGTNLDDGMTWEIQPAYRQILRTKGVAQAG
jgi:hypothetical protein